MSNMTIILQAHPHGSRDYAMQIDLMDYIISVRDIYRRYSMQYDAYYNVKTGEWLEKKCSDAECEFCKERPEKAILRHKFHK